MPPQDVFTHTEPNLLPVLEELRHFEPIFHTQAFGLTAVDREYRMALDYWEIGASGRHYSREFILSHLAENPPIDAHPAGWETSEHALRQISGDTYLLTYTLRQDDRLTHRATLWRNTPQGWMILFHQGTIVSGGEDETTPADS